MSNNIYLSTRDKSLEEMSLSLPANNELIVDDKGDPSVMVKIPKLTYADVGIGTSTKALPAFIVNGKEIPYIYISKYQNIVKNVMVRVLFFCWLEVRRPHDHSLIG